MHNLFVYGTLLKGLERNFALDDAQQIGGGTIRARLYDLGPYPGIKPGDAKVRGEVYSVSDDTLELIDQIEGYDARRPESALFTRQKVVVGMDSGDEINAWCYFYADDVAGAAEIEDGDYLGYRRLEYEQDANPSGKHRPMQQQISSGKRKGHAAHHWTGPFYRTGKSENEQINCSG